MLFNEGATWGINTVFVYRCLLSLSVCESIYKQIFIVLISYISYEMVAFSGMLMPNTVICLCRQLRNASSYRMVTSCCVPGCNHRCRSRQIFGGAKDFCLNFPNNFHQIKRFTGWTCTPAPPPSTPVVATLVKFPKQLRKLRKVKNMHCFSFQGRNECLRQQ